jgi:hypothetical protein
MRSLFILNLSLLPFIVFAIIFIASLVLFLHSEGELIIYYLDEQNLDHFNWKHHH